MKSKTLLLVSLVLGLNLGIAQAQPRGPRGGMGGPPAGPQFGGFMAKIFGDNSNFTGTMEFHVSGSDSGDITIPGKVAISDGKMRFEMDMTEMKGGPAKPPQVQAMMKQMGLDKMVMIGRPDKKVTYVVLSGAKAYLENPIPDTDSSKSPADYKEDATKLGEESVSGHDCIKYKVVETGSDGVAHESKVWRAKDLKEFPLKIETVEDGKTTAWILKEVKMEKSSADRFEPPADFKKYNSYMELMMSQMQAPPN